MYAHQMSDTGGQYFGFSAACSGHYHYRAFFVCYCFSLLLIQLL